MIRIPNRPDDNTQIIRVESRQLVGSIFSPVYVTGEDGEPLRSPRWSENAKQTLDGIIETGVFGTPGNNCWDHPCGATFVLRGQKPHEGCPDPGHPDGSGDRRHPFGGGYRFVDFQ